VGLFNEVGVYSYELLITVYCLVGLLVRLISVH